MTNGYRFDGSSMNLEAEHGEDLEADFSITPDAGVRARRSSATNARRCLSASLIAPLKAEPNIDMLVAAGLQPRLSRASDHKKPLDKVEVREGAQIWRSQRKRSSIDVMVAAMMKPMPTQWSFFKGLKAASDDSWKARICSARAPSRTASKSRCGRCRCSAHTPMHVDGDDLRPTGPNRVKAKITMSGRVHQARTR